MGYGSQTSASELVGDLADEIRGKTILITGASLGSIGGVFAETVARAQPALLILAGRNPEKLKGTVDGISKQETGANVRTLKLDLGSLAAVREAAAEVKS